MAACKENKNFELVTESSSYLVSWIAPLVSVCVISQSWKRIKLKKKSQELRTFAPKFSNIDFFLKILPLKDDELVMSEM